MRLYEKVFLFSLIAICMVPAVGLAQGEEVSRTASAKMVPSSGIVGRVEIGPGQHVRGPLYDNPPLPPPGALASEAEEEAQLPTPIRDDEVFVSSPQEMETGPGSVTAPEAPGSAIVYRNSAFSPPSGYSSSINEPSVGSQSDGLFTTHNWYAAVSTNNGSSFSYISPYTTFPNSPSAFSAGFCCDQRVAQDPSRDLILWFLQYIKTGSLSTSTNGVRLAVGHGQAALASNTWTYYNLTPGLFGLTGKWFDFPHMQASANYLYFTTNIFQTTNNAFYGAMIARLPLSQLDTGGSINIDYFITTTYGSILAVSGAEAEGTRAGRTTMYFAAVFSTTSIRVLKWPEAGTSLTEYNISGLATTSLSTYVCVGPDSLDPCTRANPRMQTGWITDAELGLMWTSSQNGSTRPYPYTRVVILNPSSLAVISQPDIWNSQYAWLYPAVSINERGHLGGTIDVLGGTLFPTIGALIRDDLSPDVVTSGWEVISVSGSTHGTPGKWGDYNGAMTHEKYPTTWLGGGHVQIGGSTDFNSQPRNFWFMRERDAPHWDLIVSKAGTGSGTVTSSPAGINCGSDCTESVLEGTVMTLTASASAGSTFSGWSGACSGTGTCIVTMTQARSVTATFSAATYTLTVSLAGNGNGTVTSTPAGINCGVDCSEAYSYNTSVTLTATPSSVLVAFSGWSGACTGTGSCVVTMNQAKSVTATFTDKGQGFFTITPCRVLDTRITGTPLTSSVPLIIAVAGTCGVPPTAKAVSLNLTAIQASGSGNITLYPGDSSPTPTWTISFPVLKDRGNNAVMPLAWNGNGTLAALALIPGGTSVHIALDVNGYFQ